MEIEFYLDEAAAATGVPRGTIEQLALDFAAAPFFSRQEAAINAAELPLNFSFAWYAREERTLLRVLVAGPWLLLPLGLVGLAGRARGGARPDADAFRLWAACVPLYAASVALFFVAGRYRQPLLVPLAAAVNAMPIIALAPIFNTMFSSSSEIPRRLMVTVVVLKPSLTEYVRGGP